MEEHLICPEEIMRNIPRRLMVGWWSSTEVDATRETFTQPPAHESSFTALDISKTNRLFLITYSFIDKMQSYLKLQIEVLETIEYGWTAFVIRLQTETNYIWNQPTPQETSVLLLPVNTHINSFKAKRTSYALKLNILFKNLIANNF